MSVRHIDKEKVLMDFPHKNSEQVGKRSPVTELESGKLNAKVEDTMMGETS